MTKEFTEQQVSLGPLLRSWREERGLTLEQAEDVTKIRRRYLEALESESFAELPGEVYVRGFLRIYAEFLGLDPAEVLRLYRPLRQPTTADLAAPPRLERMRMSIGGPLLAIGVIALVALAAIYLYQQQNPPGPDAAPTAPVMAAVPSPAATSPPAEPTATVEPSPTPTNTPTPLAREVTVRIDIINSETGIDAHVNGSLVDSTVFPAGERRSWTGESIKIVAADAGNVVLTVNGQHVGVFGAKGERKEFEWLSPARAAEAAGQSAAPPAAPPPPAPAPGNPR